MHDTVPPTYGIKRRNSSQSSSQLKRRGVQLLLTMETCSPISCSWRSSNLILHWRRGLILDHIGSRLTCFHDPLEAQQLFRSLDRCPWLRLGAHYWMGPLLAWSYMNSSTCAATSTRTWVNQLVLFLLQLCRKINSCNRLRGLPFTYYLRESLCRREEELSAARISLFWERSFVSLSLLDVFPVGGGLCLFVWLGACLFCFSKTSGFLLFTCSLTNWEWWNDYKTLMTVRASSAHGMG